ncbi:hypothetical protein DM02DRAFT_250758 [Periconia macrospinosa]|uniref:CRIB domain-containing protein n=1 Tax=Periconia macrospinosa TaxID=97972 RepID=A0A2V1E199_9PLEO|nr:hypothetical protein DM02DRAFT_250758 [Periconia macrospinosa]
MEIAGHIATAPYTRPVFVKRTHVPDSVQSSVDSLVTMEPSGSTSTSDLWASPGSDTSSYTEQPSPEQHSGGHMAKRNSVFNLRSRSNTSNSISSSAVAATSPNMPGHETTSHRLSQDLRHLAGQSIVEINSAKRTLFRGKKGKRQSGSFSPGSPTYDAGEMDASRRTSVLRKNKKPSFSSESFANDLKPRISSPFDFKHLTHTDRHQFAPLTGASENELVAGFHNLSTQTPRRDLTGIKADDLRLRNLSTEGLVSTGTQAFSPTALKSPMSLRSPQGESMPFPFPSADQPPSRPQLRTARSVESFSRPGVNPRMHRHTQSANTNANPNPPPRTTSRVGMAPIHDLPEETTDIPPVPSSSSRRNSGVWSSSVSPQSPTGLLPSMMEESDYVGHALTTPDNSAIHPVTTPPFTPGLDDVAEEPERFASPRPAPLPPIRSGAVPTSPIRTSLENFTFGNPPVRGSPTSRPSHTRKVSFTSASPKAPVSAPSGPARPNMSRPLSQCSDTLGSLGGGGGGSGSSAAAMRRRSSGRRMSVRRKSNTWRVMEESWEDDIDYIYDNALEADCDLEWDCASTHSTTYNDIDSTPPERPSLVVPPPQPPTTTSSSSSDPEMRSAVSASTISTTGLSTPSDLYHHHHHHHLPPHPLTLSQPPSHYPDSNIDEGFTLTPSLLIPQEYKQPPSHHDATLSADDPYLTTDDILSSYDTYHHHHSTTHAFPLLDSTPLRKSVASSSTQSSHFRSSKRSSYDSSLISSSTTNGGGSGQASAGSGAQRGSWTTAPPGIRRSASSSGSLPELVHSSRHARRDFGAVVERLEGEVAAFGAFVDGADEENLLAHFTHDRHHHHDELDDEEDTTTPLPPPQQQHQHQHTTFFTEDAEHSSSSSSDDDDDEDVETDLKSSLELAQRGKSLRHRYGYSDGAAKMLASSSSSSCAGYANGGGGGGVKRSRAASSAVQQRRRETAAAMGMFPSPPSSSAV